MKMLLPTPFEIRRPLRLWMTGSVAVVMAAVLPLRDGSQAERSHLMRLLRHSHFSVNETVLRLEASARDQGLSVLALLHGTRPVLVLASSIGGTPVVMQDADSPPAMPLSLMVREAAPAVRTCWSRRAIGRVCRRRSRTNSRPCRGWSIGPSDSVNRP